MAEVLADLVLRGGTIVDGTGAPAFVGDVAIAGSRIQAIGPDLSIRGREERDVTGKLVTPGWIDVHTHFDGQVMWDAYLTPSTANGVTTCIFGNCGIGFAPVKQDKQGFLINLIEALEDIPGTALHEGLKWEWETFEEYMNALKKRELACDVGVMIGHSAVRAWVMGERANLSDRPGGQKKHPVSQKDVQGMAALVRDAVAVGAMGFSTSRAIYHRDGSGVLTPGSTAQAEEVRAIGRAVAEAGGGIFQVTTDLSTYDDVAYEKMDKDVRADFMAQEWQMYDDLIKDTAGKVKVSIGGITIGGLMSPDFLWGPNGPLEVVEKIDRERPGSVRMQQFVRPQWFLMNWVSRVNPFMFSRTLRKVKQSTDDESLLLEKLRRPETRETIVAESRKVIHEVVAAVKASKHHPFAGTYTSMFAPANLIFQWQDSYEPDPADSVAGMAKQQGRHVLEVMYDLLTPASGELGVIMKPLHSYQGKPLDAMRELFLHPMCVAGGDDAGAHVGIFTDASNPTHLLTHWVRDRTLGPKIGLEEAVKKHTGDLAEHFNLCDRGALMPGLKADVNVIALDELRLRRPVWKNDLPMGAGRWVQSVDGYVMTLVSGRKTFEAGCPTGLLPGRLVSNPLANEKAWRGDAWRVVAGAESAQSEEIDLKEYALKRAQGGGASSIARLARDIEQGPTARSRL